MAITGSGTSSEPYVVDTYQEFVSTATNGENSIYLNIRQPNQVWDMNVLAPDGTPTLSSNQRIHIDGNGVTILNAYITSYLINLFGIAYLDNFNVENFVMRGSDAHMFGNGASNSTSYVRGCRFSGLLINGANFARAGDKVRYTTYNGKGNSFNLKFLGTSEWNARYTEYHDHSDIYIDTSSTSSNGIHLITVDNSRIRGVVKDGSLIKCTNLTNSVFDVDLYGTSNVSSTQSNCAVNQDKLFSGSTHNFSQSSLCTTQQLGDASYLASIGFPIGG